MTTKLPLSRHTGQTTPARPVFRRQNSAQEDLLLPPNEESGSPSSQIASLFAPPSPSRAYRGAGDSGEAGGNAGNGRVFPMSDAGSRPAAASTPSPAMRNSSFASGYGSSLSVGKQLLHARLAHGWTVEDVAFQTRIPHTLLREMENDDLSNFANLTYAKSFLKLYSRHLGLDLTDYLDQFDTSVIAAVTGHEYIQTASLVRSLSAPAIAPDAQGNPRARLLLASVAVVVVAVAAFVFHKFSSATPSADQAQPNRSAATETYSQPGGTSDRTAATPSPAAVTANRTGTNSQVSSRPVSYNLPPKAEVISE